MGAPYCPKGNNYKYWPPFSADNLEYLGNGLDIASEGSALVANAPKIYNGYSPKLKPLSIQTDVGDKNIVGTHIESYLSNVTVGTAFAIANNGRIIGICLYNTDMTQTIYGIWFSYNLLAYGGGRWVWHGTGPDFNGLTPTDLCFGPHGIYLSMDFLSRGWINGYWNYTIKFKLAFTSGAYSGASREYTKTNLDVGGIAHIGFFFDDTYFWRTYNTCKVDNIFAWGPTISGKKCGRVYDLMPVLMRKQCL
jgi:hypothetical protein